MQWNLKKKSIILGIMAGIILIAGGFLIMSDQISILNFTPNFLKEFISRASVNPENNNSIGYEFLDEGEVVHIWNIQNDYFFNKTSGIQFTNNYQEYWTRNIFCAGYKAGGEWYYDCNDALPFTWNIKSDNETYVNITGWRDKTISGRTVRLGLRYHLKLNDANLSVQLSVEHIDGESISNDLGFAWRVTDIQIGNDTINDKIKINDTKYWLNESLDLTFRNMSDGIYEIYDVNSSKYLWLDWGDNLNYKVEIKNTSKYNAPITLGINIGTLDIGQEKHTTMYWLDANPNVVDESFEGPGYEEAGWAQTIGSGNTVDNNSAGPGSLPTGGGSECLKTEQAGSNALAYTQMDWGADEEIVYARAYIYVDSWDTGDTDSALVFAIVNAEATIMCGIRYTPVDGLRFWWQYWDNGYQFTGYTDISEDTWYRVEMKYDTTDDTYGFKVDGDLKYSGTGPNELFRPDSDQIYIGMMTPDNTGANIVYFDLVAVDDSDWIGPADTCTCAGLNNDWEIDHSDSCTITTPCELGTGTLNFTGTGTTQCDTQINTTNLGDPGSSGILEILDDCAINIR